MKTLPIISVVSPLYNDGPEVEERLYALDAQLKKLKISYEIVCLDDASCDMSIQVARRSAKKIPSLFVSAHTVNQGIAKTYRELYFLSRGSLVVLYSLDGEWDPKDVVRLIRAQKKTGSDIVVGVRTVKQYTIWRSIISFLYNTCTQWLFGVATFDAGSIKIYKRCILEIPILSYGVFDEAERMIRARRAGYSISHISISHNRTIKKRRGIRLIHVWEAIIDMCRVYIDIHRI